MHPYSPDIYAGLPRPDTSADTGAALAAACATDAGRAILLPILAALLVTAGKAGNGYDLDAIRAEVYPPEDGRGVAAAVFTSTDGNALGAVRIDGDTAAVRDLLTPIPRGAAHASRADIETWIKTKGHAPLSWSHPVEFPDVRQVLPTGTSYPDNLRGAVVGFHPSLFAVPAAVFGKLGMSGKAYKNGTRGGPGCAVRMHGDRDPVTVASSANGTAAGVPLRVLLVLMPYRLD